MKTNYEAQDFGYICLSHRTNVFVPPPRQWNLRWWLLRSCVHLPCVEGSEYIGDYIPVSIVRWSSAEVHPSIKKSSVHQGFCTKIWSPRNSLTRYDFLFRQSSKHHHCLHCDNILMPSTEQVESSEVERWLGAPGCLGGILFHNGLLRLLIMVICNG